MLHVQLVFLLIRCISLEAIFIVLLFSITRFNRPLPCSENLHFQNEAKYTSFLVKMSFICMRMKNQHLTSIVLVQRRGGTRKWPYFLFISIIHQNFAFSPG